ncbi:MAG: hypothetical protein HYR96_03335 [Deltaproteobacteria bacterium]|nr:hypothetical protein [Deltaproteobacteria bacterium]MBI3294285.1 hypothetical protein [Deltaproteobacteria bacterium]
MKKRHVVLGVVGIVALYAAYLVGHYYGEESVTPSGSTERMIVSPTDVALPAPRVEAPKSIPSMAPPTVKRVVEHSPTPQPSAVFSTPEFHELTQRAFAKLPRMAEIRKKGRRDFHFAPPELTEVADELGAIGDSLERDPRLVPAGQDFLRRCALAEDVMQAARAVCLRDLKHWTANSPLDLSVFPDVVKRIADSLPPTP